MLDFYAIVNYNAFIFYTVPLTSVIFGLIHRQFENPEVRKWTSTLFGCVQLLEVFRMHSWHFLLCVIVNILILRYTHNRKSYLILITLNVLYPFCFKYVYYEEFKLKSYNLTAILIAYTSKIMGLAFDMNNTKRFERKELKPQDYYRTNPGLMDMVHFSFCYIGIFGGGGFYRYRTYDDFIHRPFAANSDHFWRNMRNLVKIVFCGIMCELILGRFWNINYMSTIEYAESSVWYKLFFSAMHMQGFYFFVYTVFFVSEFICISVGFGAYPVMGKNIPGHGPTENYDTICKISKLKASTIEYDFNTIKRMDWNELLFSPWIAIITRSWNTTYQYWLKTMFYEHFVTIPQLKTYAMTMTLAFSALWHGIDSGLAFIVVVFSLYSKSSKFYWKLSQQLEGRVLTLFLKLNWLVHVLMTGSIFMPYVMNEWSDIVYYCKSVYFAPIISIAIHYCVGKFLLTMSTNRIEERLYLNNNNTK